MGSAGGQVVQAVTGAVGANGANWCSWCSWVNAVGSTCDACQSSRCMGGRARGAASTCGIVAAYDGNVAGSGRCNYKNKIRACSF
jgi:hypothetical protein